MADEEDTQKLLRTYIGASFAVFLAFLPARATSLVPDLLLKLHYAEEDLNDLRGRRKEDSKANARVVEIFAGHRHAWRQEEKRLLHLIEGLRAKVDELEETVEELRREIVERDEMIEFMTERREEEEEEEEEEEGERGEREFGDFRVPAVEMGGESEEREYCLDRESGNVDEISSLFASNFWPERARSWQNVPHEPVEPVYHLKQFVSRREYPWKIDGETAGVFSKLKLLEQELLNLERINQNDLSKIPPMMRKQAKRYQALVGKIDDLCRRMQASDPSETTLSPEFRTQCQTEFLLEAFRLQHRANETAQKLIALQTETGKSYFGNEFESHEKLTSKRCLDSVKNNLKEIQRNLEIWLARIIGDLQGILARDGVSRGRDCYMSRYPFAQ